MSQTTQPFTKAFDSAPRTFYRMHMPNCAFSVLTRPSIPPTAFVLCSMLIACGGRTPLDIPTVSEPTSSSSGGTVADCAYQCTAEPTEGTTNCSGPVSVIAAAPPAMIGQIDMNGFDELRLRFEVCAPTGWTLHLSDSNGGNGWGGDNGSTSNDAEIHLTDTSLFAYRSDACGGDPPLFEQVDDFVSASGCTTRTLVLRDSRLQSLSPPFDLTYSCLLRVNPPSDQEGVPDALWYWGLNRTVAAADRSGSGTVSASFCLR